MAETDARVESADPMTRSLLQESTRLWMAGNKFEHKAESEATDFSAGSKDQMDQAKQPDAEENGPIGSKAKLSGQDK